MKISTPTEDLVVTLTKKASLEIMGECGWAQVSLSKAQAKRLAKTLLVWAAPIECSRHAHLLSKGIER